MSDPIKSAGGVLDAMCEAYNGCDLWENQRNRMAAVLKTIEADHQAAIAALVGVVKAYRDQHYGVKTPTGRLPCIQKRCCDLCKRADELLKEVEG